MLSGVFPVFHIKSQGAPNRVRVEQNGQKSSKYSTCSSLPPFSFSLSLSVSLSCIHISVVSLMAACYVIFACFSLHWQFLQWSKLDCIRKWRQLSVVYWGMCLLYCKDEGPWILDILPFSPLLLLLPSHLDTATVCSDFFFPSEWQHMA